MGSAAMDAQEYAMSGLETRDQQEAEAAADKECFVCWIFPNSCSRPEHDCALHMVSIEYMKEMRSLKVALEASPV